MDNLGRLIAAERNALAAIELAKNTSKQCAALEAEVAQLKRQSAQLQQQLATMNARTAQLFGTGATQR